VRIKEFGGSEHGVFDQTDTAALGGSSGGMICRADTGTWAGMITLGLRQSGDNFHWVVPIRSVRAWAKDANIEWLLDPKGKRPSQEEIDKIPLEVTAGVDYSDTDEEESIEPPVGPAPKPTAGLKIQTMELTEPNHGPATMERKQEPLRRQLRRD
jgi:hypothetical protein